MALTPADVDRAISAAAGAAPGDVCDSVFAAVFTHALDGVAFVRADGTFLRVNDAYCEMLGYSRYELEGRRKFQDITHPEDVAADAAEAAAAASGRQPEYRLCKRYLHKRGHSVPVDLKVVRVVDRDEAFYCFITHARPVRPSEEFYRIEQSRDGVPEMRPFYPLARLVRDNWKVVAAAGMTAVSAAGAAVHTYYQTAAALTVQTEQLGRLTEDLKRRDSLIEEQRRLLESLRTDVKAIKTATGAP